MADAKDGSPPPGPLDEELLGEIAHELRTPLTSLQMAIRMCVEGDAGPLSKIQASLLGVARDDCERLRATIEEILGVLRTRMLSNLARRESVDIDSLVREVFEQSKASAEKRNVLLRGEQSEAVGLGTVDREAVAFLLATLLTSAVDRAAEGSPVTVRWGRHGDEARIEVVGTGLSGTDSMSLQLSGLVLVMARDIARAHGGSVGVEPQDGRGSFWFSLRVDEPSGLVTTPRGPVTTA